MSRYGQGNYGHYRGVDVQEQIRLTSEQSKIKYSELAWDLIDIIGEAEYEKWVDENLPGDFSWSLAITLIEQELNAYECTCNPVQEIPCAGCQRTFEAKHKLEDGNE